MPQEQDAVAGIELLPPCIFWAGFGGITLCGLATAHLYGEQFFPALGKRQLGLLRFGVGPAWLRNVGSTLYIFAVVVPFFVLVVMFILSSLIAIGQGWSYNDSFHYHAYLLGLTRTSLGNARDPSSRIGDVVDIFTTLTGFLAMYEICGIAGMTTLTRRLARFAQHGAAGFICSIFLLYPFAVAFLASLAAAIFCGIEGWPYADSFLMACGWFSGTNLDVQGRHVTTSNALFLIMLCHIIAIAIKLSICNLVYGSIFPRQVARWIDGAATQELDRLFGAAPGGDVATVVREMSIDLMDTATLKDEVVRLRRLCSQLMLENDEIREAAVEVRDVLQGFVDNAMVAAPGQQAQVQDDAASHVTPPKAPSISSRTQQIGMQKWHSLRLPRAQVSDGDSHIEASATGDAENLGPRLGRLSSIYVQDVEKGHEIRANDSGKTCPRGAPKAGGNGLVGCIMRFAGCFPQPQVFGSVMPQ